VRLAFAVAAHLESEILIVDEVLAVGDAEFQKKCLGKMGEVSKNDGRTVLFVSHNMGSVISLCNKGMLIDRGAIANIGDINSTINAYTNLLNTGGHIAASFKGNLIGRVKFVKVQVNDRANDEVVLKIDEKINIRLTGELSEAFNRIIFVIAVFQNGVRLFTLRDVVKGRKFEAGKFIVDFNLISGLLRPGNYTIAAGAWGNSDDDWIWGTDIAIFSIAETWTEHIRKADEGIINGEFLIDNK
jgi:lipopolysaccharide transport system ATP-binding protein